MPLKMALHFNVHGGGNSIMQGLQLSSIGHSRAWGEGGDLQQKGLLVKTWLARGYSTRN
jgi:hypothetical protein